MLLKVKTKPLLSKCLETSVTVNNTSEWLKTSWCQNVKPLRQREVAHSDGISWEEQWQYSCLVFGSGQMPNLAFPTGRWAETPVRDQGTTLGSAPFASSALSLHQNVHLPQMCFLGSPGSLVHKCNVPCVRILGNMPKSVCQGGFGLFAVVDSTLREKTLYGIDEDRAGSGGSEADKCQMAKTEGALVTDQLWKNELALLSTSSYESPE